MQLDYIHARFTGWETPRSVGVSMSGYLGPAISEIKEADFACIAGTITKFYRLEIKPSGECYVPDLTPNRLRLKKRVEKGLFQILDKSINLDEKSPCDSLMKVSAVEEEKQALLREIAELKAEKAETVVEKEPEVEKVDPKNIGQHTDIPEVFKSKNDIQSPKKVIKRRGRKPKVAITPDME